MARIIRKWKLKYKIWYIITFIRNGNRGLNNIDLNLRSEM